MDLSIDHDLGIEGGRRRLQSGIEKLASEHAARVRSFSRAWSGDRLDFAFEALGCRARGAATVEKNRIRVKVDLPLGLRVFAGPAREYLVREGRHFFRSA